MGTGIGRMLWQDCLGAAARIGLSEIRIESDPFAEGFYRAMGATRVGDVPSQSIPDRTLPLLSFDMGEVPVELLVAKHPSDLAPWGRAAHNGRSPDAEEARSHGRQR
jgi:hypothetical protein